MDFDPHLGFDVRVKSFSISGGDKKRETMNMYGTIERVGAKCWFELKVGKQTKLEFKNAFIFDGRSDPKTVALAVKQALIDYVRSADLIPESMRARLALAIL